MGLGPGGAGASGGQDKDGGAGPGGMGAGNAGAMGGFSGLNLGYDANEPGGGITESIKPSKNNKNFITSVLNFIFNKIPGLSLVNLGVNAVTGKNIAEHLSSVAEKAMSSAMDSGATESQATEAGKQAIANAISEMPSNSFGGGEGKSQALAAIQGVNSNEVGNSLRVAGQNQAASQTGSLWDKYVDNFYSDENNIKNIFETDAAHKSDAAKTYQDSITGANDDQSAIINDIISKMQTGTGMYKPVSFNINGQDVSFIPRGARNTADSIIDAGQTKFNNAGTTATGILGTSDLTSPSAGMMAYLDKLAKAGETDAGIRYRQDALDKGINIDQQRIDANEPSTLDKWGQLVNAGQGIFDLFKTFRD